MNKEAYVSFKIAELLKDKGFNWECRSFYEYFSSMITMYQGMLPELSEAARDYNKEKHEDICSRPTHQMAMRWLREEKGIGIFPSTYSSYTTDGGKTKANYGTAIIDLETRDLMCSDMMQRKTYEDAVEAALEYCLTNLI